MKLSVRTTITPSQWADKPAGAGPDRGTAGRHSCHLRCSTRRRPLAPLHHSRSRRKRPDQTRPQPRNPTGNGLGLYKKRHLVEGFFNRIKRFRRIALRCKKRELIRSLRRSRMCNGMDWVNADAAWSATRSYQFLEGDRITEPGFPSVRFPPC